jgi:hypothetical protein
LAFRIIRIIRIGVFGGASSGLGYSHSGGVFGGWSSGTTKGTQQTEAAKQAAPPVKKNTAGAIVLIVIGMLLFISIFSKGSPMALVVGILLLVGGIGALVRAIKWNNEEWPGLYETWLRSFRCLRCGEIFAHSESR